MNRHIVTVDLIINAESPEHACDRVADLGRRLTEDCAVADWSFQNCEPLDGEAYPSTLPAPAGPSNAECGERG